MALFGRSSIQEILDRHARQVYRLIAACMALLFGAAVLFIARMAYLSGRTVDYALSDICAQCAHTLDERVNTQLAELRAIAAVLDASELDSYEECIALLARQDTAYARMGIVSPEGTLYSTGSSPVALSGEEMQRISQVSQSVGTYGLVTATFKDATGISVMLCAANLSGDGPISGMLYALLPEDSFADLTTGYASQDELICIVDQDGRFLHMTMALDELVGQDAELADGLRAALLESAHGNFSVVSWGDYRLATAQLSYNGWLVARLTSASDLWDMEVREASVGALMALALLAALTAFASFIIWKQARGRESRMRAASHDPITNIYNHMGFTSAASALMERSGGTHYALVCLRTDVQDVYGLQYGYASGRRALEDMARTITDECESGETCARLDSGQFLMLLRFTDTADVLLRLKALTTRLLARMSLRTHLHYGVYVTGYEPISINQMIEFASEAARRVMRKGDLVGLYDDELHRRRKQDEALLARASSALASGEFEVRYMPLRDAASMDIVAAEAVAIWRLSDGTVLTPGEFMPLLSRNSMDGPVNTFILESVCRDLRAQADAGRTPARVLVHMARGCLIDGTFLRSAQQLAAVHSLSLARLEVVLGESAFADTAVLNANAIQQLHAAGMRVCVDAYGQGASSLCAFGDMPVDAIRLADAFCERATDTDKGLELLRGLVALANSLHMDVYAGAVTSEQLRLLRLSGCMCVQRVTDVDPTQPEYCELDDVSPAPAPQHDDFWP